MSDNVAFPPVYFRECPSCERQLAEHLYVDRETTSDAVQREEYVRALDEREPADVARMYPAARGSARMVLRVLRCPNGGGAVVPLLLAESAAEEDRWAGMTLALSAVKAAAMASAMPDGWRPYAARWRAESMPGDEAPETAGERSVAADEAGLRDGASPLNSVLGRH